MGKFTSFSDGYHIVELVAPSRPDTVESRNWIFVLDFSGSMGWTLGPLAENVMQEIRRVPVGDTVTVAWFSGVSYHGFIVKGTEITGDRSYQVIKQAIENNLYTRNTTCFSEVLAEMTQVVTDLTPFSSTFNLLFFTDGCPVVPDTRKEIRDVEAAITAVADQLSAALFIGYGNYYNRPLMVDMAKWASGALVHSRDIDATRVQIDQFMQTGLTATGRVQIVLGTDTEVAFTVAGNKVVVMAVPEDRTVSAPAGAKVYTVAKGKDGAAPVSQDARYAAAAALVKEGRNGDAMQLLAEIGDQYLVDLVDAAYTLDDLGKAEAAIELAAITPSARMQGGQCDASYIPDPNAFCLLDAIDMLASDPKAKFYPQDKRFNYQRIGPKSKRKSGYPAFHPDNQGCPFNTLTWNSATLNLSTLARTNGHILLGRSAGKVGLPEVFSTYRWNNYALIKDGSANVQLLPASMSKETFDRLQEAGMIGEPWAGEDAVYEVRLDAVPVMNRGIAEGWTGKELAWHVLDAFDRRAELKVLNHFYSEAFPEERVEVEGFTEEQAQFLMDKGVARKGNYSPPIEKAQPTDHYMAKTFKIKVKGLSSFPKVADVIQRAQDGKKQTTSGQLIAEALDWYNGLTLPKDSDALRAWYDKQIAKTRAAIRGMDSEIARGKFAVLMGKSWFADVDRQSPTINVGGFDVTFDLGEKKVEF
jgi:hypothetical protein